MRTITIGENDAGQRLDKFLQKTLKALPMSLMYKSIRTKKIKVNRKRTEQKYILQKGDTVELFLSEDLFAPVDEHNAFLRLNPHLNIVYEDENILLVNKPEGLIVHSDEKEEINTLISQIQAYLYKTGAYDPAREQSFAPALCNRIDRNTCGIVIAAKNAEALRCVNARIKAGEFYKSYLCITHGRFDKKEDILTGWLTKDGDKNRVTLHTKKPVGGLEIKTGYRVLRENGRFSLVEVRLYTGRTHQIRAQMAAIGHPLLGDGKYGINQADRAMGFSHQALCAYKLECDFSEPSVLDAVNHRVFEIPADDIWFVGAFDRLSRQNPFDC